MDNIESSINTLMARLKEICPHFRPALFPSYFNSSSQVNLFEYVTSNTKNINDSNTELAIFTDIDYAGGKINLSGAMWVDGLGKKLNSIEAMMKVLIIGDESEIDILSSKLATLNNRSLQPGSKLSYLSDVYNVTYALKVLVSNIPSLQLAYGEETIVNIESIRTMNFSPLFNQSIKKHNLSKNTTVESSDDDDDIEESNSLEKTKKRKRRRGRG